MDSIKSYQEWLAQASYDLDTAGAMLKTGRYIYCIFMCHLSIEKALKSCYVKSLKNNPPKVHDLSYLCEKIKIDLPAQELIFLDELNDLSVPARYPDELKKILKEYNKKRTAEVFSSTKRFLLWLKKNIAK